jgi:hypothetical protein
MKKSQISLPGLLSFLILFHLATASGLGAQVNRGAAVPEQALPGGLKGMEIKDYFMPSSRNRVGVIHALSGTVVVIHRATKEAYFGRPGDAVFENDALNTLPDSRCRIRFFNSDVVTMAQETEFGVDEYVDRREEGKKSSLFSMVKGKAMFYAMRLFRYKDTRFRLKTPTAIVGVRGTQFGAHVYSLDKEKTADAGIRVADSGNEIGQYLAQAGPGGGARSFTDAFSVDGVLEILDAVTQALTAVVPPGNLFSQITGRVIPTPPGVILDFQYETEVSAEKREEGKKTAEQEEVQETTLSATLQRQSTELDPNKKGSSGDQGVTDTLANVTQLETGIGTEKAETTTESVPLSPPLKGYFSAFLYYKSCDCVKEGFASTALQNLDPADDAFAYGAVSVLNTIAVDEYETGVYGEMKGNVTISGEGTGTERSVEGLTTYLGQYNYLQWGYHAAATLPEFTIGGTVYELINKFWFVEGYPTEVSEIAALSGDYNYGGVVHGTHYPSNADLEGTYTSKVHFGSSYVHEFKMNAQGGGHEVDFVQSGSATVDSSGQFKIQAPNGTFKIDGSSVSYWNVNGAHFGPGAAEQGGAWAGLCTTTDKGAYGIFAGQRSP